MQSRKETREYAIATLLNIWGCIDWEKVDNKRAYGIWEEFTNKVKASSLTTNSYEKFVEKLCKKLNIETLKYREILEIEKKDRDIKENIMKLIREETLSLILECKLNKEIIKEQKENKKRRDLDNEDTYRNENEESAITF